MAAVAPTAQLSVYRIKPQHYIHVLGASNLSKNVFVLLLASLLTHGSHFVPFSCEMIFTNI
jgi:hypothetical protein